MTDEQINQRIAEACGWTVNTPSFGIPPTPTAFSLLHGYDDLPNYCRDLNAMHEAEKVLDYQQAQDFGDTMYNLCADENSEQENPFPWRFAVIHATARQRAEAFLRTLGKWEEGK
jgi:hypothetical protein